MIFNIAKNKILIDFALDHVDLDIFVLQDRHSLQKTPIISNQDRFS